MHKPKFIRKIYLSLFFLTTLSLILIAWLSSDIFRDFFIDFTQRMLTDKVYVASLYFTPILKDKPAQADAFCKDIGKRISARLTLMLPDGSVVGDSDADPVKMENHKARPEMAEALSGKTGKSIRWSSTLRMEIMYVAMPVYENGKQVGVVRGALPLDSIRRTIHDYNFKIALTGLFILIAGIIASFYISKKISLPLQKIKEGAERMASGDLKSRIPVPDSHEMSKVAEALNQLASLLEDRLSAIQSKQNEQDAVFSSMIEILLAVDNDEKIINMNNAAEKFFDMSILSARGKAVQEVIRNSDLARFLKKAFGSSESVEGEISIRDGKGEKFLQAHATSLKDAKGIRIGMLIVLNDVTKIKKLETVRKDFVANVSHELKTPVTSIKGYLETLLSGAQENAEDRKKFLEIVYRQSERLNSIIEDLLSLSRIEQETDREEISFETGELSSVIDSAVANSRMKADAKKLSLEVSCGNNIRFKVNPSLLEQAIGNLIDNAVKYSEEKGRIEVSGMLKDGEVRVSVRDFGCGIPPEHLSRLFERFYRVDKARSRKLGGTGLGLSIVKHIAEAHKGQVTVESEVGKGSVFTIHLPG